MVGVVVKTFHQCDRSQRIQINTGVILLCLYLCIQFNLFVFHIDNCEIHEKNWRNDWIFVMDLSELTSDKMDSDDSMDGITDWTQAETIKTFDCKQNF